MSLAIIAARGSGPSSTALKALLSGLGVPVSGLHYSNKAYVYWGVPHSGVNVPNVLNMRPPLNKWAELQCLAAGGVNVPAHTNSLGSDMFDTAWYARKVNHHGGNDLRVVMNSEEAQWRIAAGWDFFTKHVPIKRELRAWGFRGKYLATYEKVMAYPEQYQRYGRNHRNGFAFRRVTEGRPEGLKEMMNAALIALGLDFGALDVIESPDGTLTALEVNTAPGISDVNMGGAKKLAQCIKEWYDSL